MAIQEKKGWVWTYEEKEELRPYKRRVGSYYEKISAQLRRFESYLPEFAEEAERVAGPFLKEASPLIQLLSINTRTKRKYEPICPEEAFIRLSETLKMLKDWASFTKRPDVSVAINSVNRQIKSRNQEFRRIMRETGELTLGERYRLIPKVTDLL